MDRHSIVLRLLFIPASPPIAAIATTLFLSPVWIAGFKKLTGAPGAGETPALP